MEEPVRNKIYGSLKEGKVPRDWKIDNIVVMYKGGNKREPLNYRTVSLTSIVIKLSEVIVKTDW